MRLYVFLLTILVTGLILPFSLFSESEGEKLLSIKGTILLNKNTEGDLHILLVDRQTFKVPLKGISELIIAVAEENYTYGPVQFDFNNIPPGIYGIRCFIDTDGDGKLNRGMTGPTEPWGMSWREDINAGWPKSENIAFELNNNLSGIEIEIK